MTVNSFNCERLNSTGNLFSINHVEFKFPQKSTWKVGLQTIHLSYSGNLFSIELWKSIFHCSVDKLMESRFSTNADVGNNIPVQFSLPLVDEFTLSVSKDTVLPRKSRNLKSQPLRGKNVSIETI